MKTSPLHRVRFVPALVLALGLAASQGSADWAPNGNRILDAPTGSSSLPDLAADPFGGLLVGFSPVLQLCTRVLGSGDIAAGWPVTVTPTFGYVSAPVPDGFDGGFDRFTRHKARCKSPGQPVSLDEIEYSLPFREPEQGFAHGPKLV